MTVGISDALYLSTTYAANYCILIVGAFTALNAIYDACINRWNLRSYPSAIAVDTDAHSVTEVGDYHDTAGSPESMHSRSGL